MSDSPLSPEEIRAAAEVHHELAPEYGNAVVASFVDRLDKVVDARVEARLAAASDQAPARRSSRRSLLTGLAAGACAGGLIVGGLGAAALTVGHAGHIGHVSRAAVPATRTGSWAVKATGVWVPVPAKPVPHGNGGWKFVVKRLPSTRAQHG